jgi:hypothetical protein
VWVAELDALSPGLEVVAATDGDGALSVLDSAGAVLHELSDDVFHNSGGAALGDIDGDGQSEVVFVVESLTSPNHMALRAVEVDGTLIWESQPFVFGSEDASWYFQVSCRPSVTELDGDGLAEVQCDRIVVDGQTGATRFLAAPPVDMVYGNATVADLDLDGSAEQVGPWGTYRADGTLAWDAPVPEKLFMTMSVLDLDTDPEAEVLYTLDGLVNAYDADGTELWSTAVDDEDANAPCAADFDGDGETEIAVGFDDQLAVIETDGTIAWRREIRKPIVGCSGADLDGDGAAEILASTFAHQLSVFSGLDGALLNRFHRVDDIGFEAPLLVDLEQDGLAEIVFGSTLNGASGLTVLGTCASLPAHTASWPHGDFRLTNQTEAGAPDGVVATWLDSNLLRAWP